MVATRSAGTERVRIHLEDPNNPLASLCGFGGLIIDRTVATGYPDCDECVKASEKKPGDATPWLSH